MKKLLLLFSLLISSIVYSQNYYTGSTAKGTTVIYKCYPWTYNRIIIANNLACSHIIAQPLCKNGQEAAPGYGKMARINDVDFSILKSVFKDTLSAGKLAELNVYNEYKRYIERTFILGMGPCQNRRSHFLFFLILTLLY